MTRQKIIAVDARFYAEAGPGRYVKNIVKHLEKIDTTNKYLIFLRSKGIEQYVPSNPNFSKILADVPWYSWREQLDFLFILLRHRADLLYVPHFNIPVLYPFKIVTAIPDIIMHSFSTDRGTTRPKVYFMFKKFVYSKVVWWALVRSSKVIVPTHDVFNDMTTCYPSISKDKFIVAPEGVDPDFSGGSVNPAETLKHLKINTPFLL